MAPSKSLNIGCPVRAVCPQAPKEMLALIDDEQAMLASFLIMRRGCRICRWTGAMKPWWSVCGRGTPTLVGELDITHNGKNEDRPSWGCIGLSVAEAEPLAGRQPTAVKTTPLARWI